MTLKDMRQKMGYSRTTLADITGVSARNIEHYESGYRDINVVKLDTLCKLALALDCKIDDLLTDDDLKRKFRKATKAK